MTTWAEGSQLSQATLDDLDDWEAFLDTMEDPTCNRWRLTLHLLKWATQAGILPPIAHQPNRRQWHDAAARAMALVHAHQPGAVIQEAMIYIAKCASP